MIPHKKIRKKRHIAATIFWSLVLAFVTGVLILAAMFAWLAKDLPDPNNISERNIAQTTKIYDRTGTNLLYEIHGDQKRTIVNLSDIADFAQKATITAEDRGFYTNNGFDVRGILRALYIDIIKHGSYQGGSTITQQLIKNSVLTNEKTVTRKVKEIILSIEMERKFTKDQILKLYLNEIPYGSQAYGIESASETFFGKHAKDLTLSEAATLASLPKAPTYYSPYGSNTADLTARAHYIIDAMADAGYVTKAQADEAKKDTPLDRLIAKHDSIVAPHFVFYVRDQLSNYLSDQDIEKGGLKIITTLDVDKQKAAEAAVAAHAKDIKYWKASNAGLLSLDAKTGQILAMVGSANYFDDSINGKFNILLGQRQPGSSIKPIIYAKAFEKGYTPTTVLYDINTVFKGYPSDYNPHDYDGKERGPVTVRQALAGSLNVPAVEMLYLNGLSDTIDFAQNLGYTTFQDRTRYGLSFALGGGEVKPIEHIAAFTSFAQDGIYHAPVGILSVTDQNGNTVVDNTQPTAGKNVMSVQTAREIASIMSDNNARAFIFGTNSHLILPDRPVAAKSGTTNDNKDAWTIGYTPSIVTGVWVGNSNGAVMKAGADGSIVAAPIWQQYMEAALAGSPVEQFTAPDPVTTGKPILDGNLSTLGTVKIDKVTGKLATPLTPPDMIVEQGYGTPHSILYFVNKDDPRGPAPDHPENDPQFASWEDAVQQWAQKQNIQPVAPPTGIDDVHTSDNLPTITIHDPATDASIDVRTFTAAADASSKRGVVKVVVSVDGTEVGTFSSQPWSGYVTLPSTIAKGFHTLQMTAYDDVGNNASAQTTINVTSDPSPLGVDWVSPKPFEKVPAGSTKSIQFNIQNPQAIEKLTVTAAPEAGDGATTLGAIVEPTLTSASFAWTVPSVPGRYLITVSATMRDGTSTQETMPIDAY